MNTDEIIQIILDNDYNLTENINEAIFLLEDGTMIDGDFDCGIRGEDHRMIEIVIDGDRYDSDFWEKVHSCNIIRLVPETMCAMIAVGQKLTDIQKRKLSYTDYNIEEY